MKRTLLVIGVLIALPLMAFTQVRSNSRFSPSTLPKGRTEAAKRILGVLAGMVRSHQTYLSVPIADGMALRLLTEAENAQRVVEIGTSTGYSGLWFCLALQNTGGHLTTFEINHARASMAREHFREAGVEARVTVIEGDAHERIRTLKGPIDVAFIDADKTGYVDYLNKLLPLVRPGGLILAHNVDMVPEYVNEVTSNPELETIFYMQGRGLAVSLKGR